MTSWVAAGTKHNPVDPNEMESRDDIRSVAFSTRSDSTAPLTKSGTVRESRLCCKGRDGDAGQVCSVYLLTGEETNLGSSL